MSWLGDLGEWLAQLVEHAPINLLAFASVGSSLLGGCHFVSLGKTLNSHCLQWAEEFHQCIFTDICGLLPELLFSVGLLRALRFPPTAIRQMDNGQRHWTWKGWSALESVVWWRLSAIKVELQLQLQLTSHSGKQSVKNRLKGSTHIGRLLTDKNWLIKIW